MKYYIVADPHGFYTPLITALTEKGFFEDTVPHKLIVCGDILDRGREALKMQAFILDLMQKDEVILVRGNHEDLALKCIQEAPDIFQSPATASYTHHATNGTIKTFTQLTRMTVTAICRDVNKFIGRANDTPYVKTIIPATVDYYETEHYIFVHGWIPCKAYDSPYVGKCYFYEPNWRKASKTEWARSRWYNGMMCHNQGVKEDGKTIVCGHWRCSYGHVMYEQGRKKREAEEDFTPYYNDGIIALDACTAYSGFVNCLVIEE